MQNNFFSAFIITYERDEILLDTIAKIFIQTLPPEKILIVDNSESLTTQDLIKQLNNPRIEYSRVGYNSGPAGGANHGLKILSEQGYEWIYWGDDDDPPNQIDIFEKLLQLADAVEKCAVVGSVGHKFNFCSGKIERIEDKFLASTGVLEVDHIGGGMNKIINGKIIRDHAILPDKDFFFGFEDLDLDIKIKKMVLNCV